jgi:tripartite ATP-independent transporter DctM subunit
MMIGKEALNMPFSTWIPIIVMLITFVFNIPVTYGMLAAGAFYLLYNMADIGIVISQTMGMLYTGYVLMAVPLFIFTANVMNSGKVTDAMFEFSKAVVGRRKGALGLVNVVVSLIFSGMTGSAIADAAGIGKMEIDAMDKDGYDKPFSCAITAASATIGPIFPPSIPFVIYGMLSGTSIGALFMGGMVPGLLIALLLALYVMYISKKRNYPEGNKFGGKEFWSSTFKALPALFTPVILLAGIYTGVMTPTEAGAVAAFYALLISIFAYRVIGFKDFLEAIKDTVKASGQITILTGSAAVFSYIVAKENIPNMISEYFMSISQSPVVFLIATNILFLILGMFLDTAVLQFVFLPMVLPIARQLGIDMVHFGVLICLNMMIGLSTPPFGFLLFVTAGISKTPYVKIVKEIMPMVGLLILLLVAIMVFPEIVTFVPNLMK